MIEGGCAGCLPFFSNIPFVIAKIAEIKGLAPETVEEMARENAFRLFQPGRL